MNTVYRTVWNAVTQTWVAAPEFAKGKTKGSRLAQTIVVACAVVAAHSAGAQTATLPSFDPQNCDGMACQTVVSGGQTTTLTGSSSQIQGGDGGYLAGGSTLGGFYTEGRVTSGGQYVDPNNPLSLSIKTGIKSVNLAVPDPIVGGTRTVAVYDNANIVDASNAAFPVASNYAVNGGQYIGTRIATVDATGGTLNVNIGSGGATDANGNSIYMVAKDSTLFKADGSGSNGSTIVWQSNNKVQFGDLSTAAVPGTTTRNVVANAYRGTFLAFDGSTHTVNNAADLQVYNSYLVSKLQSGALSPAAYDTEFSRAYTSTNQTVAFTNGPADFSDEVYVPIGNQAVMQASGAKAKAVVAAGARLDALSINSTGSTVGAVMLADNGGTVINQGTLSTLRGQGVGYGMYATSGGQALNQGVLNSGFLSGQAGKIDPTSPVTTSTFEKGIRATGAGSTATNDVNGIINVAGPGSIGMILDTGGTGSNAGIVNVGVTEVADNAYMAGSPISGVKVDSGGTFVNAASGQIYLGRGPQYNTSAPETVSDVRGNSTPRYGVQVTGTGSLDNQGTITVGSLTQGSAGIFANASTGAVTNGASGVINVNGRAAEVPAQNAGMLVTDARNVTNAGVINLNGVNSIGLKVTTSNATKTAQASSTGAITVAGGADPASGTRNYGIWSAGTGAVAALTSGAVNLAGDGAIGVHARNGGNIKVDGGSVNFQSGTGQIGFFAYGPGSSVDINSAPAGGLNASTDGSTLFRIEDGAKINNNAVAPLIASGKNSTALQVTGVGSTANLDAMDITVSGDGATALKVEGGATGQMSGAARLTLQAGTTAVVVDNNKYDLTGAKVGSAQSTFTNNAAVNVLDARDVTAFVVKNGAKLINAGDIHLAHGTAIEVVGAGSSVVPDATGMLGKITVDDGVAGIYVHGGATLTTNDTITVDNGASGVLVGADAGKVVIGPNAHITGKGTSYGNLVTNQATAGTTLVDGATLEMQGSGAALLSESHLDAASHGNIVVSSNVGGKGVALSKADGTQTTGSLTLGPAWNIAVSGNGSGVYANTTGDLTLAGSQLSITGTQAATGIKIDAANNVNVAAGTTLQTANANATLIAGNPKTLSNAGTLTAASSTAKAIALDDNGHAFTNDTTGAITGQVALGNGTNSALLKSGSSLNGALVGGTGNDIVTVQGNAGFTSVDGGIGGADKLVFDGAQYTYSNANAGATQHFETVQLSNNSTLTLQRALTVADDGTDSNAIAIDAGSTLAVAPTAGGFVLNNPVSGAGTITTSTGGNAFDFGAANAAATGAAFTGTLALGNSTFALQGQNTQALTSATLEAGAGSVTTVGDGDQKIGGLKFNGGTVAFNATVPDQTAATSTITAQTLDASGTGTVQVKVPAPYVPSPVDTPNTANLLEQDDANIGVKLVNASSTVGSGGALALLDQNGNAISAARQVDIAQGSNVVAQGTYDYRLTTATNDGLYVNYGLKQLDLQAGQTLTLAEDTGATGAAADMSAKITGAGNLAINAGAGTVSLSNSTNDYTGETTAASGTLRLGADNALGQTSVLHIADTATTDLNGKTQTIGALDGQAGSTLNVNGGTLNIANGGTSVGALAGAGQLNVNGGLLDVQGANTGLMAATSIVSGATVQLNDAAGLGSGAIADAGTLVLNGATGTLANAISGAGAVNLANGANVTATGDNGSFSGQFATAAGTALTVAEAKNLGTATVANEGQLVVNTATDWTLANAVSGTGDLVKQGAGTLTAGDALAYTGKTDIQAGTLIVGDAAKPNVTLGGAGAGSVTVAQGATLAGLGTVNGQVLNAGTVSALNVLPGHAAEAAGIFTLANGMANSGTVNLAGASVGNQLVVKGDYVGNNGQVILGTVKGDDSSATDKLVIDGGRASGNTALVIKHAGGNGAQTNQGIRLVETRNGATTDTTAFNLSAASDGYRAGVGTIAAGPYDYSLKRGGNGGVINDWYLSSVGTTCDTNSKLCPQPPVPPTPGPTPDPTPINPDVIPAPDPAPSYRPEVGSYLNNRLFAQTMQFHTLHERQSQAPGLVGKDLSQSSDANAWVRVVGKTSNRAGAGSMDLSDTSYLVHAGGDVLRFSDGGDGSIRIGAMGAYGSSNNRADNGNLTSRGTVDGYNLGVYGTWYGNNDILSGPYVDSWVMYGKFNNKVNGQGLPTESYKSSNLAASLEAGYSFPIYSSGNTRMYIEPQGQVIVSDYRADNHTEQNGTVVSGQSGTSVTTRLGVRLHGDVLDDAGMKQMRPFAEVNWWHGPGSQSVMFDGVTVRDGLPANRIEGKVGLQGNLTKAVSVWGAVGFEAGANDYTAGKAQVGIKYSW